MKKTLIELSHIIRTNKMGDSQIIKCIQCGTFVYIYNNSTCPVCLDRKEKERLNREKQLERVTNTN